MEGIRKFGFWLGVIAVFTALVPGVTDEFLHMAFKGEITPANHIRLGQMISGLALVLLTCRPGSLGK